MDTQKLQDMLQIMQAQRDTALNQCVVLQAEIEQAKRDMNRIATENAELKKRVSDASLERLAADMSEPSQQAA